MEVDTQNHKIHIRLASNRVNTLAAPSHPIPRIFTPGEIITQKSEFMWYLLPNCQTQRVSNKTICFWRGHGTYNEGECLKSSVAGVQEQVNKLISIRPLKSRYNGEIGDVVVGRITEVQQKRWKVETNSRLDSVLLLSSVNLPGGELVSNEVLKSWKIIFVSYS